MPQLYAFTTVIEKSFMNGHKPPGTVRIWSAGCSTGEEPYTLAILMMEACARTGRNVPFHVYGTDISSKALASAKRAIFNNYSVRNTDRAILDRYFTQKNGAYTLSDKVKKYVSVDFLNLMDSESYRKYREMDIVFCRNVLIYFDDRGKKKVIDNLYQCLKPGGISPLAMPRPFTIYPGASSL